MSNNLIDEAAEAICLSGAYACIHRDQPRDPVWIQVGNCGTCQEIARAVVQRLGEAMARQAIASQEELDQLSDIP